MFLACFSEQSAAKTVSHMNEELTVAVEEFRKRPPESNWLVPVRFDDTDVADWDLGAGRSLRDLNYADIFGEDEIANTVGLVTQINNLIGAPAASPQAVQAVINDASDEDRASMLRTATKEMLLDPSRRIQLNDLIVQETTRVVGVLNSAELSMPTGTDAERVDLLLQRMDDYTKLILPLCNSIQVAARWADAELFGIWTSSLRSIAVAGLKQTSGNTALIHLRSYPALLMLTAASIAAYKQGNWKNLRAVTQDIKVSDYRGVQVSILNQVSPWRPFQDAATLPQIAYYIVKNGSSSTEAYAAAQQRGTLFYTPVSELMLSQLRPVFVDQFTDGAEYEEAFDCAELMLALISQFIAVEENRQGGFGSSSRWLGRATWRASHRGGEYFAAKFQDYQAQDRLWPPFRDGLFGDNKAPLDTALEMLRSEFERVADSRW